MELKHDDGVGKPEEWLVGSANVEMSERKLLKIQTSSKGAPELKMAVPDGKIWKVAISIRIHEVDKPAGSDTDE